MGSLTKVIILSLSLGVFAQESYAKDGGDDEVGCSFCEIFKCLFKTTKALAPAALDVAADLTGNADLHNAADQVRKAGQVLDVAGQAVEATMVSLDVNDANHDGKLDLGAGARTAASGLSNVLAAAGEGESKAAAVLQKLGSQA